MSQSHHTGVFSGRIESHYIPNCAKTTKPTEVDVVIASCLECCVSGRHERCVSGHHEHSTCEVGEPRASTQERLHHDLSTATLDTSFLQVDGTDRGSRSL